MNTISHHIRQLAFILIILALGSIIFWHLKNFIPAFLGAYTLYILLEKWMIILTAKFKGRAILAASILMIGSFIIILLPLYGLVNILISRLLPLVKEPNALWKSTELFIKNEEQKYGFEILTDQNFNNLGNWSVNEMQQILGGTFSSFLTVLAMYFVLFFILTESKKIEKNLFVWLPLKKENSVFIKKELNKLIISNAIGIPLVAMVQGVFALIGYFIAGVNDPFLWFIATCVAGIIPVLGVSLVYIPLSIMLFAQNMRMQSVFLFLYGVFIIGTVDNLFRFWLQKRIDDTHPLITVFGVIIGLELFGFIGLIFGPILLSLFLLLIKIYLKEFVIKNTNVFEN